MRAIAGLMVNHGAVGPTGDEKRFTIGIKQDAVRAAAGFETIDNCAGLRIHDQDGIVIEIAGVEQMAIGRDGDIAYKIAKGAVRRFHQLEGFGWFELAIFIEAEFEDRGAGASACPHGPPVGRER